MIIQVNMANLIVQVLQEEKEAVEEENNKCWYRDTFIDQLEVLEQDPINQPQMIVKDTNSSFPYEPKLPLKVGPKIVFQLERK